MTQENTFNNPSDEQAVSYKMARIITNVISPPVVAAVGVLVLGIVLDTKEAWNWVIFIEIFAVFLPTLYVVWLYKSGKVDGFYLPNRKQRLRPLMAIWLGNVVAFIPMLFIDAPFGLMVFVGFGALQSGLYLLVSLFWKISGHTTAVTGLSVALFALFGWPAAWTLLMIPLVSWARVRLDSHDLGQTIGGVVLGFCFVTGTFLVINAICGGIGLSCG